MNNRTNHKKLTLSEVDEWIEEWRLPLGPFKMVEEIYESMALKAEELGDDDATVLASYAAKVGQKEGAHVEVLSLFLQEYAALHGQAFADALLDELGAEGPPLLVDLLGATRQETVISAMSEILDLKKANEALLVAWACALGEIKGGQAKKLLLELKSQIDLPLAVVKEAEIALENI
ncbi:MAG: hypothetical protein PHS80_01260 [Methanothrix sp.]|nr:hypothetical protein [Methanothrix sp.]MDD4447309.1 hypothetical protein [Methanothrix sp.]